MDAKQIIEEFKERGEFVPSEYMKRVRPELFSDTRESEKPILERGYLDFHLESLTNRQQEQQFENFCRRLAEIEICPNLKPLTGPTGGGDGKTDASTFPVAQCLIERAYWGTPNPPADDNWGFAFSCDKRWKRKIESDIAKIAELPRHYVKVFFVSSRFIRAKDRVDLETDLSTQHGFEVHILDRTWILERVLEYHREEIAVDCLGLSPQTQANREIGPRDSIRVQEFENLLLRFAQPFENYANDYMLASDYRRAAFLARSLEKPRHEVEGLHLRARQLAAKYGDAKQIINCAYDHAWTTTWWYDETTALVEAYTEIELLLPQVTDAEDCELFNNLLALLLASLRTRKIELEQAQISSRMTALTLRIKELADEHHRPNNALHAETLLWFIKLTRSWEARRFHKQPVDAASEQIANELFPSVDSSFEQCCAGIVCCLERSAGMISYPFAHFVKYVTQFAEFLDDVIPEYEILFEATTRFVKQRNGEVTEGELLLERGIQFLKINQSREALQRLGRARTRLTKDESIERGIRAALGCAHAYIQLGQFWAARMEAVVAAHAALRMQDGKPFDPFLGLLAVQRLCRCELALGRIAPFLAWCDLSQQLVGSLDPDEYRIEKTVESIQQDELSLACFLLNLEQSEAEKISPLCAGLECRGMIVSAFALRYALGESDAVAKDFARTMEFSIEQAEEFFIQLKSKFPSDREKPSLKGQTHSYCEFKTDVLGVRYRIECRNTFGAILFAENLLGVIEAMYALAKWENLAFILDEIRFLVDEATTGKNPPEVEWNQVPPDGSYELILKHDSFEWLMTSNQKEICEWLHRFALKIVVDATIDPPDELFQELHRWGEEGTFDRALGTSPIGIVVANILGPELYDLNYWYRSATPPSV